MRTLLAIAFSLFSTVSAAGPDLAAPRPPDGARLTFGFGGGLPHIFGLQLVGSTRSTGYGRFDLDVLWEPSARLQSYSLGAAWHPFDHPAYLGARARFLQWRSPLTPGFRAEAESDLGVGVEAGVRWPLGFAPQLQITAAVGVTALPSGRPPLLGLMNLNLGVAWTFWE